MMYQFQKSGTKKYIVFDVDETLGYFSQLGAFMDAISFYNKDFSGSVFERFNEILDLYPEFIRPRIIEILKYIYKKKTRGECGGVFIYTNNQGPRAWVHHIARYFDYKVRNHEENEGHPSHLFDKIIAAYMINGKVVESGRTSQNKTYDDLLRITGISEDAEVCFVDDLNHHEMRHKNVLYLNVKPYVKTLSFDEILQRYLKSPLAQASGILNVKDFSDVVRERMGSIKKLISKQLNLHESNYISLNTPLYSSSIDDTDYKKSGDKLFNYIKLFLKTKQKSKKGTKIHSFRNDSKTRRQLYDNNSRLTALLSREKTKKYNLKDRRRKLHSKTQKNNKIMRI